MSELITRRIFLKAAGTAMAAAAAGGISRADPQRGLARKIQKLFAQVGQKTYLCANNFYTEMKII